MEKPAVISENRAQGKACVEQGLQGLRCGWNLQIQNFFRELSG
jgi:hypothetical protein